MDTFNTRFTNCYLESPLTNTFHNSSDSDFLYNTVTRIIWYLLVKLLWEGLLSIEIYSGNNFLMVDVPIVSFCHTINPNTTVIPGNLLLLPTISWLLNFSLWHIWCTGSIQGVLCPFVPWTILHYLIYPWGRGSGWGECTFSDSYPITYQGTPPLSSHLICVPTVFYSCGRKLSGSLWQHSMLSHDKQLQIWQEQSVWLIHSLNPFRALKGLK